MRLSRRFCLESPAHTGVFFTDFFMPKLTGSTLHNDYRGRDGCATRRVKCPTKLVFVAKPAEMMREQCLQACIYNDVLAPSTIIPDARDEHLAVDFAQQ